MSPVKQASDEAGNFFVGYIKHHTPHAVFTWICIALLVGAYYMYHLPTLMTRAEGAELYKSVGRVELIVTKDRLEEKKDELDDLNASGDTGHAATQLRRDLKEEIGELEETVRELRKSQKAGKSNTSGN